MPFFSLPSSLGALRPLPSGRSLGETRASKQGEEEEEEGEEGRRW